MSTSATATTKTISVHQLANILAEVKGATPISFTSLTDARARKGGNPFSSVQKLTKVNAFTGADYSVSVNRALVKQGDGDAPAFEAQPRTWGTRIGPALVSNLDKKTGQVSFYLPAHIRHASKPLYLVPKVAAGRGEARLRAVPKAEVQPWLPAERPEAPHQGLERPVVYRDFSLSSIVTATINGQRYRIRHDTPMIGASRPAAPIKPKQPRAPKPSPAKRPDPYEYEDVLDNQHPFDLGDHGDKD